MDRATRHYARFRTVAFWTAAGILAGCGEAPPAGISFQSADSSGLFVATTMGAPEVGFGSVRVAPDPLVTVGTVAGDSVYQFSRIRGGALLEDGSLAILDGSSSQLRIFDAAGTFVRAWGRRGQGPGEFQRPIMAGRLADTLIVLDPDNRRITRIDPTGGLVDEVPIAEDAGGFFQVQGTFGDGTVVAGGGFFFNSSSGETLSTGLRRAPTGFVALDSEGELVGSFGPFPGLEMYFEVDGPRISARVVPFGRITDSGVAADRLYVGTADRPEVAVFAPDGAQLGIIRWEAPPRSVTQADRSAYLEESLADADDADERRRIETVTRDYARSEFPPYQNLEADSRGNLWVNEYRAPGDDVPRYLVFDEGGQLIARVELPPRVQPLEIGEDYLLGRRLDEFDIEYVEVYRLVRE